LALATYLVQGEVTVKTQITSAKGVFDGDVYTIFGLKKRSLKRFYVRQTSSF